MYPYKIQDGLPTAVTEAAETSPKGHLFIAGEGKSTPDEYEQPGHVAELAVTDIAEWISGL